MQKLVIIILLYFFNLSISLSASFDCYNASTKTEIAICNNEQLSNKDSEMGKVYKEALII